MGATDIIILVAEIIGTIAFAISGAMVAIENKLDLLGVVVLGSITAVGGGVIRDTLLGTFPAQIFTKTIYVTIAFVTTLIVFLIFFILKDISILTKSWYKKSLNIFDSIGLGIFCVLGASVTLNKGYDSFFMVIFCATITAVGGGIVRDIFVLRIPAIFKEKIYALAAVVGGMVYYLLYQFNMIGINAAIFISMLVVIIIRLLDDRFKWTLPKVKIEK